MVESGATGERPRILFFGMYGRFSLPPLYALLEGGVDVCGVVMPARGVDGDRVIRQLEAPKRARGMLPMAGEGVHLSVAELAWERGIPVWEARKMGAEETLAVLRECAPDLICVACFSLYIPRAALDIPRLGVLNVHPSLLPDNRGPDPIFWTFRRGDERAGVTLHLMDEGLDSGPIVAQEAIEAPEGIGYAGLEERCAQVGGRLLVKSVWELYRGESQPRAQDEAKSCYLPRPEAKDFRIDPQEWDARHIYNFTRGVRVLGEAIQMKIEGRYRIIEGVASYSHNQIDCAAWKTAYRGGRVVPCKKGWVVVYSLEV